MLISPESHIQDVLKELRLARSKCKFFTTPPGITTPDGKTHTTMLSWLPGEPYPVAEEPTGWIPHARDIVASYRLEDFTVFHFAFFRVKPGYAPYKLVISLPMPDNKIRRVEVIRENQKEMDTTKIEDAIHELTITYRGLEKRLGLQHMPDWLR